MPTGSRILIDSLKKLGIKTIFGIPGGAIIPVYDELFEEKEIRHILMRHEQGAAHAADGFSRASGKIGVCMSTSGPGATNLVTGITTAYMDSSPIMSISGQVPVPLIGVDAFQEADVFSLMLPITKTNFLIRKVEEIPVTVKKAYEIATSGRPGPVHIDLPKDVQVAEAEFNFPEERVYNYETPRPDKEAINKAVNLILKSERPVIIAGGGCVTSNATKEVIRLAELIQAPVTTSLMGKGVVPETHPLSFGLVGMHGTKAANKAVQESDLVIGVGVRFSDRTTGSVSSFAPKAKKIHINIDLAEKNKTVDVDVFIHGDAKESLKLILSNLKEKLVKEKTGKWRERLNQLRKEMPKPREEDGNPNITPEYVIARLNKVLSQEDIVVTEVGQNQMWAAIFYKVRKPRKFISSGGLGTMGFGLPASIGAKAACPECNVVDVAGDGSFLMVCNQLPVTVESNLPIVVAIFDNRYLGMVRQWQELFYEKRYSHVYLGEKTDLVKVSQGFGAEATCVEKKTEFDEAIKEALSSRKTYVIDIKIAREANVFPMVPPGEPISHIIDKR